MEGSAAAVSTYFRRLKTQFYMLISRFLLGKGPVFFLVGFQNRYRPISTKDPCHRKTAFSENRVERYKQKPHSTGGYTQNETTPKM